MAMHGHCVDGRALPLGSVLLPELKAAVKMKSCGVNATNIKQQQLRPDISPRPKPRVRAKSSSTATPSPRKQSSSDDGKRALKSETGRHKPVPAPRKNVPKVPQQRPSSGSAEQSREGTPCANAEIRPMTSDGVADDDLWEDEEPDVQQEEKSLSLKRRQWKTQNLVTNRMVGKKPPRKPPRSPGTFGRKAVLLKPTLSDDDDEGLGSKEDHVYEDVVGAPAARDVQQCSNKTPVTSEKPLWQKSRPKPRLPRTPRPQGANRLLLSDSYVESVVVETVAGDSADEVQVNEDSRPRSVTVGDTEETVYDEPIIHRSYTVSGATHAPSKSPPKRREIPRPPSTGQASPRRQPPPLPVRPRPRIGQHAAASSVAHRMCPQLSHGVLNVKANQQPSSDGEDSLSGPLRPRSISSQNLMKYGGGDDDDDDDDNNEEPLVRCQSFDMVDVTPSSSGRNKTADTSTDSRPYYHEVDAQRESICSGCDPNVGYDSIMLTEQYGLELDQNYTENGHAIVRRISTVSVGSAAVRRTLWSEQPEVIESGILDSMSEQERKLQEALFEVIASEASYYHSLSVLVEHFMGAPELSDSLPDGRRILDKQQRHVLFSNLPAIWEVATEFHESLQERWHGNVKIDTVCDIIQEFAVGRFDVYVKYCSNQLFQNRLLDELNSTNPQFVEVIRRLEMSPVAQNLNLGSYLILPVQRITRFALLILAILERTPEESPNYKLSDDTLRCTQNLVDRCNEGARAMERTEQMIAINKQVRFEKLKGLPLISPKRWLLKRGPVMQLVTEKMLTRVKISKQSLYLFVFTDLILVTKHKQHLTDDWYATIDYAFRPFLQLENVDDPPYTSSSGKHASDGYALATSGCRNAFKLILLENARKKTASYLLSVESETDKARWMDAVQPPNLEQNGGEIVYGEFDCPQVQATYSYRAQQADELSLSFGDVIKVIRKMPDGWYEGERLQDGEFGWFPSTYVKEIESEHTRARNLKQRYQLILATERLLPHSAHPSVLRKTKSRLTDLFG